jgi:hypothetical protein
MSLIIVALIVALSAIINLWITGYQRKSERREDYRRQDEVAEKAAEAAKLLLVNQQRALVATEEVARVAATSTSSTNRQLERIHTLVNSDMTAALVGQRDQARLTLLALKKIIALDSDAGRPASPEDRASIEEVERQLAKLGEVLADRAKQQDIVDAEGPLPSNHTD